MERNPIEQLIGAFDSLTESIDLFLHSLADAEASKDTQQARLFMLRATREDVGQQVGQIIEGVMTDV